MKKNISIRNCPICKGINCEFIHTVKFVLFKGHPLSNGYNVVCCARCGFVYADTKSSQKDYDKFYSKFYSKFSLFEDSKISGGCRSSLDEKRLRKTASCIAGHFPNKNIRIIDIGCANGGLLRVLKEIGYTNLYGLDPSLICVENTKKIQGVCASVGSLSTLPKNIGLFDLVILSHVLEHVQDVRGALLGIKSILNNKGVLYIEVPNADRYYSNVPLPYYFNTEHINHFSLHSIKNLLRLLNFEPIQEGIKEIIMYPVLWTMSTQGTLSKCKLSYDSELSSNLKQYIAHSEQNINIQHIDNIVATGQPLIVWGIGSYTAWLLANSSLGKANIVAFMDNSPKYWGLKLLSRPVISPALLPGRKEAIVIATRLFYSEILKQIKEMKLSNKIITID